MFAHTCKGFVGFTAVSGKDCCCVVICLLFAILESRALLVNPISVA